MKSLITVIKFTMKDMLKKKSFIISTVIILVLIVVGFSIPKIIQSLSDGDINENILISDSSNIFEGNLSALHQLGLEGYNIIIKNSTFDEIKEKIENEEIDAAIIIEKENETIKLRYLVENTRWVYEAPEDLIAAIGSLYSNMQISKLGLTPEELQLLTPNFETSIEQTKDEEEIDEGNIFVMMVMSFVLSFAIIFFTAQVALSITTEKTSKIMETLITSTKPRTIVLGKTIGIGIIGLVQVMLIIATALISANAFLDKEIIETVLDMTNITPYFVIITIVYFILGYFTYALLYALTGSMVSKPEDIQSANTPVSFIAMIGFYLGYFSISIDPTSKLASFAVMFPFSSPFSMPSRVMMGLASLGEVVASIAILIITVLIIAKVAIKVYSNAILNYGSKKGLKDIIKTYKEK